MFKETYLMWQSDNLNPSDVERADGTSAAFFSKWYERKKNISSVSDDELNLIELETP